MILILHTALCLFMTGLIWMVQLVHYPSFHFVENNEFQKFHGFHSTRISIIVMPIMLIELGTACYLWLTIAGNIYGINAILNVLLFASTFLLSVPFHAKLAKGKSREFIEKLVLTNWPRTLLWSIRSIILVKVLYTQLHQQ
jgi:hypothetical protein